MPAAPLRPPLAALLAAGATLAVVGCGEADSLSGEEFTRQADAICRQAQAEFAEAQRAAPATAAQAEEQAEALAGVSREALDQLGALEPPEDLQQRYEDYLEAREAALGHIEDGREAAAANDPQAYAAAKRRAAAGQAERLQLARGLGLRDCSRPAITLDER